MVKSEEDTLLPEAEHREAIACFRLQIRLRRDRKREDRAGLCESVARIYQGSNTPLLPVTWRSGRRPGGPSVRLR